MKTPSLVLAALLFALPASTTGCGRTACFEWTAAEGVCPAQDDALAYFTHPACGGAILSVDSDPDPSEGLCCYTVTKREGFDDSEPDFGGRCGEEPGFVDGSGGGSVGSPAVGAGGGVPAPPCIVCSSALTIAHEAPLCPQSQPVFDAFLICVCAETCAAVCGENICATGEATMECAACMQDSEAGCGEAFNACVNDL